MGQTSQSLNSIVVICRNNLELTRKTLRAALKQDVPVDVIVYDNASTDGTRQWLQGISFKYSNVYGMGSSFKPVALAAAWNAALKCVWARGGEHALVLNNDVVIAPDTYQLLLRHGGSFVTTVSVDNEEQFAGTFGQRIFNERPHPNFSGFLIRKECWDRVGAFNENYYPAYCEDAEYHVRMHRSGIRAVCIDLPMLHLGNGANTLRFADPAEAAIIRRGADRNRDRFLEKYGCKPGEPEYEALFSDATFGVDRGLA